MGGGGLQKTLEDKLLARVNSSEEDDGIRTRVVTAPNSISGSASNSMNDLRKLSGTQFFIFKTRTWIGYCLMPLFGFDDLLYPFLSLISFSGTCLPLTPSCL